MIAQQSQPQLSVVRQPWAVIGRRLLVVMALVAVTLIGLLTNVGQPLTAYADAGGHLWSHGYGSTGDDGGTSVAVDSAGNVLMAGYFNGSVNFGGGVLTSAGAADIFLAKYSSSGVHLWSKHFGSTDYNDSGQSVSVDSAGNVLVIGYFGGSVDFGGGVLTSTGGTDIFLAKYNSSGAHVWSKRFGSATSNDRGQSVSVDSAGNVLATGYFYDSADFGGGVLTSTGSADIFLAKYNSSGAHLWSKRFGNTGTDQGQSVSVDSAGNVLATGYFYDSVDFGGGPLTSAGGNDIFLAKYNSSGTHLWSERFGNTGTDQGQSVSVDSADNVLVTGSFNGSVNFGGGALTSAGSDDIFLARYNSSGAQVWSQRFGNTASDRGRSVDVDALGNVIVTGYFNGSVDFGGGVLTSTGGMDFFLAQYNSSGTHLWSKRFGNTGADLGTGVSVDSAGNVLATGSFNGSVDFGGGALTGAGGYDIVLAKYEGFLPHLTLTKSVTPAANVPYHGVVTYTLALSNSGWGNEAGAWLTDTLPAQVDFGRWVGENYGAQVSDDQMTWSGVVTAASALTFTFTATHTGDYGDAVNNTAQFSGTLQAGSAAAAFNVACYPGDITVQNTQDSGAGSLRQALAEICPGRRIDFAPGLSGQTITLSSTLQINKDLTIDGSTLPVSITLSGNNAVLILSISGNARVTLDSLTLTRGYNVESENCFFILFPNLTSPCAAGLDIDTGAAVTLTHSTVSRNTRYATNGEWVFGGGGAFNLGALTVIDSAFISNTNLTEGAGGGIFNAGEVTVINSVFTGNSSGKGGAISSVSGTLTLTNSAFTNNQAERFGCGGAIHIWSYVDGGMIPVLSVSRSNFVNNLAVDRDRQGASGGAICASIGDASPPPPPSIIADSTFIGNAATGGTDVVGNYHQSYGGAIDLGQIDMTILRSTFRNNSADQGGAIDTMDNANAYGRLTVRDSSLISNVARFTGGGLYSWGNVLVQNSTFISNQVTGPSYECYYPFGGGGMAVTFPPSAGQFFRQVENSTFSGNASAGPGGGILIFQTMLTVTNSTIADNVAVNGRGGGIYVQRYDGCSYTAPARLDYANTLIADNRDARNLRAPDCQLDAGSTLGQNVNNLAQDGSCSAALSGDPLLRQWADNGGPASGVNAEQPMLTRALREGSPALDAGDPATCLATDERGVARPQGATCDIGAYERGPLHLNMTVTPATNAPYHGLVTYTLTLTNAGGATDPAVTLTQTLPAAGLTFQQWIISPTNTTLNGNEIRWQGSLTSGNTLSWTFAMRNVGAFNQPGDYGDILVSTAQARGASDPGAWAEAAAIAQCSAPLRVDTFHNDGPCSLRQMLAESPAGATVDFRAELAGQTIPLAYTPRFWWMPTWPTLIVTRDLTLDAGSLPDPVIVDGQNEGRILQVSGAAKVTLNNLTLQRGNAITSMQTAAHGLVNNPLCAISGGATAQCGGALRIDASTAVVTLTRVSVLSSTSRLGGGIYNAGQLTVLSSRIADNICDSHLGGGSGDYQCGGGLYHAGVAMTAWPMAVVSASVIAGNVVTGASGDYQYGWGGGGIATRFGALIVNRSIITGNRAGNGGGIFNRAANLLVSDSLIANNVISAPLAAYGGGLWTDWAGWAHTTVENSTFSGNQAFTSGPSSFGGAIGGWIGGTPLTLRHNTLTGNRATFGGGIYIPGSTLNYRNTLFSNNTTLYGGGLDCDINVGVGVNANNLVDDGSCGAALSSDPLLGTLADNRGPRVGPDADVPIPTHALLPNSPAIDAGAAAGCLSTDQRGQPRNDLACDIGAYERKFSDGDTVIKTGFAGGAPYSFGPTWISVTLSMTDTGSLTVTKRLACPGGTCDTGEVQATWYISSSLSAGLPLTLSLCYTDTEVATLNEAGLRAFRWDGVQWTVPISTGLTVDTAANCVILTGIYQLSAWTLKDVSAGSGTPTVVTLRDLTATANTPEVIGALGAALVVVGAVWIGRRRLKAR